MVTLVVYLVIILGLTVTVGWSVLSYQRSAEIVTLAQRNAARMDQIASLVRANLRPVEFAGKMRAPLGERTSTPIQPTGSFDEAQGKFVTSSPAEQVCADERAAVMAGGTPSAAFAQTCYRMTLPRWVVADTKTPWGADYGYCPYSVDAVSGTAPTHVQSSDAVVRPGEGQAYAARIVRSRGRDFVLQSENQAVQVIDGNLVNASSVADQGIVGFVVAPPPNVRGSAPLCSQITLRDGAWIVQGPNGTSPTYSGSVVPVFMQGVGVGSANVQDDVVLYAAAAKASADAKGTGDSPADPIPFKDLLDLWHYMPWQSATFFVAPGTYTFGAADTVPGSTTPRLTLKADRPGRSLRIASSSQSSPVVIATSDTADLTVGIDTRLENVSLSPGVRLRAVDGARVQVTGGSFGLVRVDGGDLDLWGASLTHDATFGTVTTVDLTSGRLKLGGGTVQIADVPAGGVALNVLGGELVLDGTDVAIGAGAGALSIATQSVGRVVSVPKANGTLPIVQITGPGGTVSSPIVNEATAGQDCDAGADGIFTCTATCPVTAQVASAGSCHAEPGDEENPIPPSLVRSSRHNLLTKSAADANAWSCTWRSGFNATPGTVPNTVNLQYSLMPATRVEARCLPNATLVAPAAGPPA